MPTYHGITGPLTTFAELKAIVDVLDDAVDIPLQVLAPVMGCKQRFGLIVGGNAE